MTTDALAAWNGLMRQAYAAYAHKRMAEVEHLLGPAVRQASAPAEAWDLLALSRLQGGRVVDAQKAARRATQLASGQAGPFNTLGLIEEKLENFAAAERAYRRAVSLSPNVALLSYNLGNALFCQEKIPHALECYMRAAQLDATFAPAWFNAGRCHRQLEDLVRARTFYEHALALRPDYPEAQYNLATLRRLEGDYPGGWDGYDHRWVVRGSIDMRPEHPQPAWDGRPLGGQTLLLWCEQGFGDNLQFVRLLSRAVALGAAVLVECPPALLRLFAAMPGVRAAFATGMAPAAVDWQLPMASLPVVLGWTPEHPCNVAPYLAPPAGVSPALPSSRVGRLRVGVTWAGNAKPDPYRTCPLEDFLPVLSVSDVTAYSLQLGDARRHLRRLPADRRPMDLAEAISDFSDTAALLAQLDLVVTIDTSLAHLAGALGRPTWVLLPRLCDWRWGWEGGSTPWYPTMRLYRQSVQGEWPPVLEAVADDLRALIRAS